MGCSHRKLLVISLNNFFVFAIYLSQPKCLVLFIRDAVNDIPVFLSNVYEIFVVLALDRLFVMQIDFDVMDPGLFNAVLIQGFLEILWIFLSTETKLEILVIREQEEPNTSYDEICKTLLEIYRFIWRLFCLLLLVLRLLSEVESFVAWHAVLMGLFESLLLALELLPF